MGHTFSHVLLHVIFSTKNRMRLIQPDFRQRLYEYLAGIARDEFGAARKIGGTDDHLHGLISLRTDVSIAEALRKWKSLSSLWVHREFPNHQDFAWQSGYGVFSVSESNAPAVIQYIETQVEHHAEMTFEQEFIGFLKRHNVQYDPRHIFD